MNNSNNATSNHINKLYAGSDNGAANSINNSSNININNHNNINMTCNACNRAIYEKIMSKTSPDNKVWHSGCLKCCECNKILDSRYFETSGRLYCRNDYLAYFGPSCFGCGCKISDEQYFFSIRQTSTTTTNQTASPNSSQTDPTLANQQQQQQQQQTNTLFFHEKCFACNYCNRPLQKGDKYCIIDNTPLQPQQQQQQQQQQQPPGQQTKALMICHEICAVKFYSANNSAQAANASGSHPLQANPPAPRAKRGRMKQKPA